MTTSQDQRWATFKVDRERFELALDTAIEAAAAIGSNPNSPLSALYQQRYAEALPRLVWLRSQTHG